MRTWHGASGEIIVSWNAVACATGYRVARASTASGPLSSDPPANPGDPPRHFQYDELVIGPGDSRRYYSVTAYNGNGEGPSSEVVCGEPPGPPSC